MTGLPKGYVILRLRAGHHSEFVMVRDGQNRTATVGCDSRQQLLSKTLLYFVGHFANILRVFTTVILNVSDKYIFEYNAKEQISIEEQVSCKIWEQIVL